MTKNPITQGSLVAIAEAGIVRHQEASGKAFPSTYFAASWRSRAFGRGEDLDLCRVTRARRPSDEQSIQLIGPETSASSCPRRNARGPLVFTRGRRIEHVDVAFSADDVDALAARVEEEVVTIARARHRSDALARGSVKHEQPRWLPYGNEQAMPVLVERHGIVVTEIAEWNVLEDRALASIQHDDLSARRHIDEYARAVLLEAKGFRMPANRNSRDELQARRIDDANRAFTIT